MSGRVLLSILGCLLGLAALVMGIRALLPSPYERNCRQLVVQGKQTMAIVTAHVGSGEFGVAYGFRLNGRPYYGSGPVYGPPVGSDLDIGRWTLVTYLPTDPSVNAFRPQYAAQGYQAQHILGGVFALFGAIALVSSSAWAFLLRSRKPT